MGRNACGKARDTDLHAITYAGLANETSAEVVRVILKQLILAYVCKLIMSFSAIQLGLTLITFATIAPVDSSHKSLVTGLAY